MAGQIFTWPFKFLIEGEAQSLTKTHTVGTSSNMVGSSGSQWFRSMEVSITQGHGVLGGVNSI